MNVRFEKGKNESVFVCSERLKGNENLNDNGKGNDEKEKNVNVWKENVVNVLSVKDLSVSVLNVIVYSVLKENVWNVWNVNVLSVSDWIVSD